MIETILFGLAAVGAVVLVALPLAVVIDWWAMRRGPGKPWDGEDER